jgi:hypothetical protein
VAGWQGFLVSGTGPPLPSFPCMAAAYIVSTAKHVVSGRPMASPELQAARLAACEVCDHLRPEDRRCGVVRGCGCGCPVDDKAQRLLEVCPDDRWPSIQPPRLVREPGQAEQGQDPER